MKRGGATPKTAPTGWVFFRRDRSDGFTIRWQRGDREAYVLKGKQIGSWTTEGLLGKIPVSPAGWVDLAEVRLIGEKWMRAK
ncbi:MAG: hypothetical protein ACRDSL_16510 [Pseudonocardiaceae bacterium]